MYDVQKLTTPAEYRTVMVRARAKGLNDVYAAVFRRFCELNGNDHDDPTDAIVRETYEMLAAYEQLLTEKDPKNYCRQQNPSKTS